LKLFNSSLVIAFLASGCVSTQNDSSLNQYKTDLIIDSSEVERSPAFLMRYRSLLSTDEKSKAWELANKNYKLIKENKLTNISSESETSFKRTHELSIVGHIFSPLRKSNYVSGLITYEDSYWINDIHKFKKFSSNLYTNSIIPSFALIQENYGFNMRCVQGCEASTKNKIFEFTKNNSNDELSNYNYVPEKFYASVCMLKQKDVHKLNAPLLDPQYNKNAKFNNYKDGLNIHFFFPEESLNVELPPEQLTIKTRYNRNCLSPKSAIDAFNFKFGRDVYRSLSQSFPEFYATLNFDNQYALYQGHIWKLENKDVATDFYGLKTKN
tara:strand:+ start:14944 stop:15918 length:975 start_codon:yes stop_codon:yes gene_type:complete